MRQSLQVLRHRGWEVVCLRLPIHPELADLEDVHVPPELVEQLCSQLGLPLLDHRRGNYATLDGSHMGPNESRRFSSDLAVELERRLGW